jgi:hypothetical protein
MGGDQIYDVFMTSKSVIFKSNGLEAMELMLKADNEVCSEGNYFQCSSLTLSPHSVR